MDVGEIPVSTTEKTLVKPRQLLVEQTPQGSLALFEDASKLKDGILAEEIWNTAKHADKESLRGSRGCFVVQIGDEKLFVKPKRSNTRTYPMSHLRRDVTEYRNFPEDDKKSRSYTELAFNLRQHRAAVSVLHEIQLLEELKTKYLARYGEAFPIEEAVGAFISHDQDRFTLYKEIPGKLIDAHDIRPTDSNSNAYHTWQQNINERIEALGYIAADFQAVGVDLDTNKAKFVIIDTDIWFKKPEATKQV